jgi:hypothetical protein
MRAFERTSELSNEMVDLAAKEAFCHLIHLHTVWEAKAPSPRFALSHAQQFRVFVTGIANCRKTHLDTIAIRQTKSRINVERGQ